jgi:small nuclear ribonucleoprotein (snRNP)-like protein
MEEEQSFRSRAIPLSEDAYCNSTATPADGSSPAVAKLLKLLFRRMRVGVKDGRYFLGRFHCIDKQGNTILQDAGELWSARASSPPPRRSGAWGSS